MKRKLYISPYIAVVTVSVSNQLLAGSDNFSVAETTDVGIYGDESLSTDNALSREAPVWGDD